MNRPPREIAAQYDRSQLPGQFLLCRSADLIPQGWEPRRLNGWLLAAHPGLPIADIVTPSGSASGWLLGIAIDDQARIATGCCTLGADGEGADAFERDLYRLGGNFLAIFLTPRFQRVYLDPAGARSCVFAPDLDIVCATPSLIPYGIGCDDDEELQRLAPAPRTFGLGLTPRRGVERVLPNHYLDLASWQCHRHWPREMITHNIDPEEALAVTGAVLDRHIGALTAQGPVYTSLSAGHDSRCVLAGCRPFLDQVQAITLAHRDHKGRVDTETARVIARRCGVDHRVIPWRESTEEQREAWRWRTGFSLLEPRGMNAVAMWAELDGRRPEMAGLAGEVARASYLREFHYNTNITTDEVLRVMHLPATPALRARADAWLKSLPVQGHVRIVDMFFIEQRMGCWGSLLPCGLEQFVKFRFFPFVHRDAFATMLALPDDYKLQERFQADLIRLRWPELARIPFNREPLLRRGIRKVQRRVWQFRRSLGHAE